MVAVSMVAGSAFAQNDGSDLQPGVQTSKPGNWSGGAVTAGTARAQAAAAAPATPAPSASSAPAAHEPPPAPPRAASSARNRENHQHGGNGQGSSASGGKSAPQAARSDRIQLGTTEISGNRELPKLMYIVPWQRPQVGASTGRPPNSLVDEALTPVDRSVFERQNRYYAALDAASGTSGAHPASTAATPSANASSGGPQDER
jgi:hypothetical protein